VYKEAEDVENTRTFFVD